MLFEKAPDVVGQLGILRVKRGEPLRALVFSELERLIQAQARRAPPGGIHMGHVAGRDPIRGGAVRHGRWSWIVSYAARWPWR